MRPRVVLVAMTAIVMAAPSAVRADDYFTLIVSGASGGLQYAEHYERWRSVLMSVLRDQAEFRDEHLIVLAETPGPGVGRASREGVRQAVEELRRKMTIGSVLWVVLFGHGTYDGVGAKFNLVGPDLEAVEWDALLDTLPGRIVFVNTTAASFPFVRRLAGEGRVVITATDSSVQRYVTVFPEFFVEAFTDPASDSDKNGRVSVWEAFAFASAEVRRWYRQQGRLATERAILEDTGDSTGKEADQPGPDGALAARLYVGAGVDVPSVVTAPSLAPLVSRRAELEERVTDLKAQKDTMDHGRYMNELERLLIHLARVSRELRRRTGSN